MPSVTAKSALKVLGKGMLSGDSGLNRDTGRALDSHLTITAGGAALGQDHAHALE